MQKYQNVITDINGNALKGASITVKDYPGGTTSVIYSDNGTILKTNPFTTDPDDGEFAFYAANGRYTLSVSAENYAAEDVQDIILFDGTHIQLASKSAAAALTLTQYDDGTKVFITSADGGEFTVRYNATPATYADDGGSACGTQFIPSGGDGTIGIVRDFDGPRYPEWYGAVGDGTTNDATALNLAYAAAGHVALTNTYLAGSQITVPDYTITTGKGRTKTSILKGFNGDLLSYGDEASFSDLTFDGVKATYTGNLLIPSDQGHRHLRFNRVYFEDSAGNGIELKESAEGLFDDVYFDGCNDYAIKETQGLIGDVTRYTQFRSCEVRNSKGGVHSVAGSRHCYYDIRIQLCSEHGYRIEGACANNEYDNVVGNNDGSGFYIDGVSFGRPVIRCRVTNNLQSPPVADYTGNPSQIHFVNLLGRQDIILLGAVVQASAATPDVAIRAETESVAVTQIGAVIADEMDGVWLLALQESLLPDLDFTTNMNEALSVNFVTGGAEPPYLYDHIKANKLYIGTTLNFLSSTDSLEVWETFCTANAGTGAFTITLPLAADAKNREFTIIKVDASANAVTVDGNGAETINGAATVAIAAQYESLRVFSNGTTWYRTDIPA